MNTAQDMLNVTEEIAALQTQLMECTASLSYWTEQYEVAVEQALETHMLQTAATLSWLRGQIQSTCKQIVVLCDEHADHQIGNAKSSLAGADLYELHHNVQ